MRTTTKLKQILIDHTLDISMDGGSIRVVVFPKNEAISDDLLNKNSLTGKSWSEVIGKTYSLVMKRRKVNE